MSMGKNDRLGLTRRAVLGALAVLPFARPAAAQVGAPAVKPAVITAEQRADLKRIEDYLNALTTIESRFVQFNEANGYAEGKIYLWRPQKLRIEYDPPVPLLIVADGSPVMLYDSQVKETVFIPLDATPAKFLLRPEIRFDGAATLTRFDKTANTIRTTMVSSDPNEPGSLTLAFADRPLQLVRWSVKDPQGQITDVALVNPQFGVVLDKRLFWTIDPTRPEDRRSRN